jgi:hypothetical protein
MLLALALAVAEAADTWAQVTLVAASGPVTLTEPERASIAKRVEVLMAGCAISSVTEPDLFASRSLPGEWQTARGGAHLYVRFPKPLVARRGRVEITEVVIGLQHPSFIGPELSRHDEAVVGHVKCNGHRALALMCWTASVPSVTDHREKEAQGHDRGGDQEDDQTQLAPGIAPGLARQPAEDHPHPDESALPHGPASRLGVAKLPQEHDRPHAREGVDEGRDQSQRRDETANHVQQVEHEPDHQHDRHQDRADQGQRRRAPHLHAPSLCSRTREVNQATRLRRRFDTRRSIWQDRAFRR